MHASFRKIRLIRYLIVWRINGAYVFLPENFSVELSRVLGSIIADRLPSRESGRWKKALAPWDAYFDDPNPDHSKKGKKGSPRMKREFPDVSWPADVVLFPYPGKRTYGFGELVFWELKVMGDAADHGFFLETLLPAMEEASFTTDSRWSRSGGIWGRFDVHAVYAARGPCWEPVVSDGRLDLGYRADTSQWARGLAFEAGSAAPPQRLSWLTSFEFEAQPGISGEQADADSGPPLHRQRGYDGREIPDFSLEAILEAVERRLVFLARGKKAADALWNILDEEGRASLREAMDLAVRTPLLFKDMEANQTGTPGRWAGKGVFAPIAPQIIPWLELASILHIGRYTHLGCGTFSLS